jgi:cell division protein FtsB
VADVRDEARRRASVRRPATRPAAADRGRSRVGDPTRPIARERRIATSRRTTVLLGLAAVAIAGALAAALFVIPVRTYFDQSEALAERSGQLDRLEAVNRDLEGEVARLRTADGVREAAREELGYVEAGERRESIIDRGVVPTALPAGWPYDLVTAITGLRRGTPIAASAPAPATTLAPEPTAPPVPPNTAPPVPPATAPPAAP